MKGTFIFEASRVERDDEVHFAARVEGRDCILTFFHPEGTGRTREALKGAETSLGWGGREIGVQISPATYENMLAFDRQVAPERRLVALGKEKGLRYGLGTGNRVVITWDDGPGLRHAGALGVFGGIFQAMAERGLAHWFVQQSIVRELIPEGVDQAQYPGMGHTGGYGPRELLRSGLFAFLALGGYSPRGGRPYFIGADADHAIVTGTDEEGLARSLELNKTAIAESRDYTKFTVDTCHLFGFPTALSEGERRRLLDVFSGRSFAIPNIKPGEPGFEYRFADEEIIRLGEKYWRAVKVHKELYDYIARLKGGEPFDYELSLDETERPTDPRELLFYLVTLEEVFGLARGNIASVAPNVGFRKRADYEGDLEAELKPLVNELASIVNHFDAVICFHSGSGAGVRTGKGPGVDEVLAEATGGRLQLKVSGILQEILWRVLAESEERAERALFERAWEETRQVVETLNRVYEGLIAGRTPQEVSALLADKAQVVEAGGEQAWRLVRQVLGYGLGRAQLAHELLPSADPAHKRPDDDFFRHFAYLVFRDLRPALYATIGESTWHRYEEAVRNYVSMRAESLGLGR